MSSEEVANEIDQFERNLDRQGISSKRSSKGGEKQKYHGTPTEILQQMQKDSEATAKKDQAQSKTFLRNLKGKDVDASYARIDRDKRKAKQEAEEKETAKSTAAAKVGEQFILELLRIDLAKQKEDGISKSEREKKAREWKERAEIQRDVAERQEAEYKRVTRMLLYPPKKELTHEELMAAEDTLASRIRERDNYLRERAIRKAKEHEEIVRPIVHQIVDLALYTYDYQCRTGFETIQLPLARNVKKAFEWGEPFPPLP